MSIEDIYDNIAGSLNYIDMLEGVIRGLLHGDFGYRIVIPRADKGGSHRMSDAIRILEGYGVDTFWYGFDSQKMYFRVKKRQARWAEYILLHAGVELLNPAFDHRNAGYAASHSPGWMPRPWSVGPRTTAEQDTNREREQEPEQEKDKGILAWLDSLL